MLSTPNKPQIAYSQASTPKTSYSILHSMQGWLLCMQCKSSSLRGARVYENTFGRAVEEIVFALHRIHDDKTFCSVHEIRLPDQRGVKVRSSAYNTKSSR